ncbi:Pkinase-domain-containing protein [Phanerochaete sordida]|uniref:Pkinase-domain-containing protein n=1 Tax=Phanerochaete sordida TaxID=48140 RepID=A0A9P3G2W8_9APHY|nr:Pkinase-domain-containing protein [Phanerochaete sordida]
MPDMSGRTVGNGQYQLIHMLGSGSYGVVYRAIDLAWSYSSSSSRTSPRTAVKVLHKAALSPSALQRVRREVSAHREMSSHPNVVSMHDAFEDKENIYIVLDYCPGGDMFEKVVDEKKYFRNDEMAKSIFLQILDAVEACHRKRIYHRDLKPENILISRDGTTVYLTDFGLATCNQISETFGCGSSYYMSPECIGEETARVPYSNRASDIWALGVILVNIITSRSPWNKAITSDRCFREYMVHENYLREMLPISEGAQRILRRVFTFDPVERITLPALRHAVLELDTFFMSDAEISHAAPNVRIAAAFCGLHIAPAGAAAEAATAQPAAAAAPPRTPPMHFADTPAHASPLASAQVFVVGDLSEEASSAASSAGPVTPVESAEELERGGPHPAAMVLPAGGIFEPLSAAKQGGWAWMKLRGLGLLRDERVVLESLSASPWSG